MCVNPALPSYIHSVYFPPDGHGCKNVVYQASPEVRSALAIYPKVLPSDLSTTMEIKLSRDISFSRVCNGPVEARGYTFFQQHIKTQNKEIFTEPVSLTTSVFVHRLRLGQMTSGIITSALFTFCFPAIGQTVKLSELDFLCPAALWLIVFESVFARHIISFSHSFCAQLCCNLISAIRYDFL